MGSSEDIKEFMKQLDVNGRSEATKKLYRIMLTQLLEFSGGKPFKQITREDMVNFLEWKRSNKHHSGKYPGEDGVAQSTYSLYVTCFRTFYRWLYNLPKHQYPEQVANLKPKRSKRQPIKPSEIITKKDYAIGLQCIRSWIQLTGSYNFEHYSISARIFFSKDGN